MCAQFQEKITSSVYLYTLDSLQYFKNQIDIL